MSITLVRKSQIRPLNIIRSDINTTTSGSALITKVIAGTGLALSSSTGVNPGTGDVTIALSIATASVLGGVKIGSGLTVAVDGTISVSSVSTTWGSITGLLSNQTDLQAALNAKYNNPTGTTSQYIDGTGAYQTFPSALSTGYVRHEVKAGVAINIGQAVYVTGSDGTNMIVGLASNASEATSSKTMGLMESTVAINGKENVVTEGLLAGLNTIGANPGDPVWLGVGGNLIYGLANKPNAPQHLVFIGIVTRVNANNGEIFVKVQNGFELNEIHDVDLKSTLPINGHILGYNGTLWVNKTIAGWLGYTPQDAATAITTSNIGSQSVNYANSAGSATVAGYVNNQSGQLFSYDNRVIAPADTIEGYLQFGFTSWRNDNNSPWADYLHLRSYSDSSGGTDNLIMFLKNGIGMRIWQQSWGSTSPYAEYVDVWTTGNFTQTNVNNWNTAYSWGNHATQSYATQTYVNTAIANLVDAAPPLLDTLNELAAALGDDPNFATTVANNIAGKVSKSGDTMTGNLNWAQTDRGLTWGMNTDGAYIKFFNTGDGDDDSRLEYATSDNGDEYHRWVIAGVERMNLRTEGLNVNGIIYSSGYGNSTEWYTAYTWGNHAGLYASISHTHTFASITSKPTTIAGYGITNAYTDAQIQNFFNGANAITGYNKSNWDTAYSWGNHASAGYRVNSANNTAYVYATTYSTVNYDFTLDPRLSIDSMSIKLWDNYFNNSGLGVDYGSLLDIHGRGGHVHSQFYMDASNALYYRSSPYNSGWNPWQEIWTTGNLTNLNQLINGPGYITGYTETDTLQSVTSRGSSTNTFSSFNGGLTATKTAKNTYGIQIKGGFYGAPRLQLYDLAVDGNAFLGLGTDMSGGAYEFSNYFPRYAGYGRWSVGSWAGAFGTGQYVSGYNEKLWITESSAGFTVPLTISGNTVWHAGNDGSGSGLDADTVDGVQADSIVYGNARGTNDSVTTNNNDLDKTGYYTSDSFATKPSGVANWMYIEHIKLYNANTAYQKQLGYDTYDDRMWVRTKSGGAWSSWKQIWTSDSLTNLSQLTNGPGYITGYTETDTLASVTGRGATTNTASTFRGGLYAQKAQVAGNYTTAALWTESYDNTTTGIAFHISGNYGGFLEMRTDRILYWADNTIWHSGNLTNLSQLANGPGYLTSLPSHNHDDRYYTESESDTRFATSGHTHDLMRYSLRAPGNVDSLTTGNFRDQLFGTSANGWAISTARWNSVPSALSGMNAYGTMFAWSGSDTHGFIATNYDTPTIQVGGGNGNLINWKVTLIHSSNIGSYALTSYTETDTLNSVTSRGASTSNAIEVGGLTVITTDVDVTTYQGRFQVYNASATGNLGYRIQTDEQGGWRWQFVDGGNNEYFGVDYPSGDVTVRGTITEQSSLRYKENIINLESITEKVDRLRPVRYNKIGTTNTEIGLIAEEVAEVFPEFVNYNAKGEVESLNYTRLSVVLLQTVKELSDKINKLETK